MSISLPIPKSFPSAVCCLLAVTNLRSEALTPPRDVFQERADAWQLDYEVGSLWRASNNTFLDYHVVSTALSVRSPAHWQWDFESGHLLFRNRISLLAEAIIEGPENHYLGIAGSPSIEWWASDDTYLHFSIGGGVGVIDSQGVAGGQGQDLTYNWFMSLGVRHYFTENLSLGLGVWFQHLSNRGATDPNPGLDALGPMVGVSWKF